MTWTTLRSKKSYYAAASGGRLGADSGATHRPISASVSKLPRGQHCAPAGTFADPVFPASGIAEEDGSVRMVPFTHQMLAQYVGTSREIVTHYMNQFRRQATCATPERVKKTGQICRREKSSVSDLE